MSRILEILDEKTGFSIGKNVKLSKNQAALHQIIYDWRKAEGIDKNESDYLRAALSCAPLLGNPIQMLPAFQMPSPDYIESELDKLGLFIPAQTETKEETQENPAE